jgi:2-amino-4-hydroxy-6-hydroxymethyldihydropteridine diphosphokinase
MDYKNQIYISIGSNKGNRLEYLQRALALISLNNIEIDRLSSIYETSSWGFKSNSFYNACVKINTLLSPHQLLKVLLEIESQLGRLRNPKAGYNSRTIDLDILFYGDLIISDFELILPHPKLHLRNFVLAPLKEIAPKCEHPLLKKNISLLLQSSPDNAICKPLKFSIWSPPLFDAFPYIVIEGNIGIGKTTLAKKIATRYDAELLTEAFSKNFHLKDFYKNPKKFALAVETFFLKDRIQQASAFWEKRKSLVVADYSIYKSLVFAGQNLEVADFKKYKQVFDISINKQEHPNLLVYLHAEISQLESQIKKRGRDFEKDIKKSYLKKIENGYHELIKSDLPFPVISVCVTKKNFEINEEDFQKILFSIYKASF